MGHKPLPTINQFTTLFAKVPFLSLVLKVLTVYCPKVLINGFTVYDLVDRALATGLYLAPSLLVRLLKTSQMSGFEILVVFRSSIIRTIPALQQQHGASLGADSR